MLLYPKSTSLQVCDSPKSTLRPPLQACRPPPSAARGASRGTCTARHAPHERIRRVAGHLCGRPSSRATRAPRTPAPPPAAPRHTPHSLASRRCPARLSGTCIASWVTVAPVPREARPLAPPAQDMHTPPTQPPQTLKTGPVGRASRARSPQTLNNHRPAGLGPRPASCSVPSRAHVSKRETQSPFHNAITLLARGPLLAPDAKFKLAPSTRLVGVYQLMWVPSRVMKDGLVHWLIRVPSPLAVPSTHIPLFNPRHAHAACPAPRSCPASPLSLSCAYPYLVGPRSRSNRRPATVNGPGPLCPASRTSSSLQPSARASLAPPLAPPPAGPLPHHLPPHAATAPFRCA